MARDDVEGSATKGHLLFSWFDARNDNTGTNQNVDLYMAVFDPSVLP